MVVWGINSSRQGQRAVSSLPPPRLETDKLSLDNVLYFRAVARLQLHVMAAAPASASSSSPRMVGGVRCQITGIQLVAPRPVSPSVARPSSTGHVSVVGALVEETAR
jgi:hypothetical protein